MNNSKFPKISLVLFLLKEILRVVIQRLIVKMNKRKLDYDKLILIKIPAILIKINKKSSC